MGYRIAQAVVALVCFTLFEFGAASAQPPPRERPAARPAPREAARPAPREAARPAPRDAARPAPGDPAARPAPRDAARPAPGAAPDPATPSGESGADKEQKSYAVRLRQLAEKISSLKELVSQTKKRLALLKESVLGQSTAGSELVIVQDNRMGKSFRLLSYRYLLDGKQLEARNDLTGKDSERGSRKIYAGPALEGVHILTVEFVFRGHGFGVFRYLRKYRYRIRSSHRFKITNGTATQIRVVAKEKGTAFTPLKQRLSVTYEKKLSTLTVTRDRKGRVEPAKSK